VLEETAGLVVLKKHNGAFNKLLLSFTDLGFSLCWQIGPFQDLGLPQNRERLAIIPLWYAFFRTVEKELRLIAFSVQSRRASS
jgi:site-specific DNA-cytosine methylase